MSGPYAFPFKPHREEPVGDGLVRFFPGEEPGMTLRDYFAAKAPPQPESWMGFVARNYGYTSDADCAARWAYHYADAMLKARAQRTEGAA